MTDQPEPKTDTGAGIPEPPEEYRLYQDLADWWLLISPPEEYAEEAAYLAAVLGAGPRPAADVLDRDVLDLGSGGGCVALHLKGQARLTLVDLSERMLAVSRQLNPECEHLQGDMRTLRLGRVFDAVLVHDAVDYMTSEDELRQVIATAFEHTRPGGIALFVPDHTAESFSGGSGAGGGGQDGSGRQASFQEWSWDPDPGDSWIQAEYEFSLRSADGRVRTVHETHRLGAFGRADWDRLLAQAGFEPLVPAPGGTGRAAGGNPAAPSRLEYEYSAGDDTTGRKPVNLFAARRPAATAG
jgi:SAM-dependent methyltransferase